MQQANKPRQFTEEIKTTNTNLLPYANKYKVEIMTYDEFPFLDMGMSWSLEVDLKFGVFSKKGQQLKYIVKESNHTPSTRR